MRPTKIDALLGGGDRRGEALGNSTPRKRKRVRAKKKKKTIRRRRSRINSAA